MLETHLGVSDQFGFHCLYHPSRDGDGLQALPLAELAVPS